MSTKRIFLGDGYAIFATVTPNLLASMEVRRSHTGRTIYRTPLGQSRLRTRHQVLQWALELGLSVAREDATRNALVQPRRCDA